MIKHKLSTKLQVMTVIVAGLTVAPANITFAASKTSWYYPFGSVSKNIECKKGVNYSQKSMKNGTSGANWNTISRNVINNTINSGIGDALTQHLPK